ncbi:MAG: type I-E CRISPR-associated protein Cse1/CasA [Nitrospinota bacterium]|nr:type I-E CRISPR-associated protein Cse1/CasA [Nitrospinota bacterium]
MNILEEPFFSVITGTGGARLSLPGLLAALGKDDVRSIVRLRRHQADAFHVFLCYLAGLCLAREGQPNPVQPEEFWLQAMRRLSGGNDDSAWTMVVEDPEKPAFMQPPVVSKKFFEDNFKPKAATPDGLDTLITSKNHDMKIAMAKADELELWAMALISMQTMSPYSGRYNYGIARMNSGSGSRPFVSLIYNSSPGARWRRDCAKLIEARPQILKSHPYKDDGHALLWTLEWDLKSSLSLDSLDPFFIEISRAVRIVDANGSILAMGAPTDSVRIEAKEFKGHVGDPWIPVKTKNTDEVRSALTVSESGFTARLLRDLIFQEGYEQSFMSRPDKGRGGGDCLFHASVLAGGNCKTNGFHEARIMIPPKAAGIVSHDSSKKNELAELSKKGIEYAGQIQNRFLKMAILSLLEGGPERIDINKREASSWRDKAAESYSRRWEDEYFPWLWDSVDKTHDEAELDWLKRLKQFALDVLHEAMDSLPKRSGMGYRAKVRAEGLLMGGIFKNYPQLKERPDADSSN